MKKFLTASAALLAFAATGCAPMASPVPTAPVVSTTETLIDERALFAAEAAYNVAASAYLAIESTLTVDQKAPIKAALGQAYGALILARHARDIGEADSFVEQTRAALAFASRANTLIGS